MTRPRQTKGTPLATPEPRRPRDNRNWGIALDLGIRMGLSVIIGIGAGLLVDSWLKTSPLFTLIGVAVGIAAAMFTIWEVARENMR